MTVRNALALACVAVMAGCAGIGEPRGTFLATSRFEGAERLSDQQVEGTACKWAFLIIPMGDDSLESAWAKALAKSPPGTTGLQSADIEVSWPLFVPAEVILTYNLLLRRYCTTVRGFPAKRVEGPQP